MPDPDLPSRLHDVTLTTVAWPGGVAMAFYRLGLGIPFILFALGFGWMTRALTFVRQHRRGVSAFGGAVLIVMGVLLVTGEWEHVMSVLRSNVQDKGIQV